MAFAGGMSMDDQRAFNALLEQMQISDSLKMYNRLVERCFNDCVNDFSSNGLSRKENPCITRCVEKYLKSTQRTGAKFSEVQAAQQAAAGRVVSLPFLLSPAIAPLPPPRPAIGPPSLFIVPPPPTLHSPRPVRS
eukprot:tig00020710_g13354.t1